MTKKERVERARNAGSVTSARKAEAAQNNGKNGGRQRDPAIDEFIREYARTHDGKILSRRSASVLISRTLKS